MKLSYAGKPLMIKKSSKSGDLFLSAGQQVGSPVDRNL